MCVRVYVRMCVINQYIETFSVENSHASHSIMFQKKKNLIYMAE